MLNALGTLRLNRVQLCRDWNVCGVTVEMHQARVAAFSREASAAARLIDLGLRRAGSGQPALSAWASGLESRISATPTFSAAAATAPPAPRVTPQILELLRQQGQLLTDTETARSLVGRILAEFTLPEDGSPPAACLESSSLRADVASAYLTGRTGFSRLSTMRDKMDEICRKFDRWQHPDERLIARGLGFIQQIHRVQGWMRHIERCDEPGRWSSSCENNFGAQPERATQQVQRAMRLLSEGEAAVQRVPDGAPFPCRAEIWPRLRDAQFEGRIVRINVPRVGASALRLCESIGVDGRSLAEKMLSLRNYAERSLAGLTEEAARYRSSIQRTRAAFHIGQ